MLFADQSRDTRTCFEVPPRAITRDSQLSREFARSQAGGCPSRAKPMACSSDIACPSDLATAKSWSLSSARTRASSPLLRTRAHPVESSGPMVPQTASATPRSARRTTAAGSRPRLGRAAAASARCRPGTADLPRQIEASTQKRRCTPVVAAPAHGHRQVIQDTCKDGKIALRSLQRSALLEALLGLVVVPVHRGQRSEMMKLHADTLEIAETAR